MIQDCLTMKKLMTCSMMFAGAVMLGGCADFASELTNNPNRPATQTVYVQQQPAKTVYVEQPAKTVVVVEDSQPAYNPLFPFLAGAATGAAVSAIANDNDHHNHRPYPRPHPRPYWR